MKALSKATQEAVEQAILGYPAKWNSGICAWDTLDRNTGERLTRFSGVSGYVCHAPLTRLDVPAIVVNAHRSTWQHKNPDFIRWVFQESPFAHGVVNKDNEKQLLNHASAMDSTEIGKGGVLWLCKAIRHFVEDEWKPDLWTRLRNEGLDGFQAFIGSDILNSGGEPHYHTHVSLFTYGKPTTLRKHYDEIRTVKRLDFSDVSRDGEYVYGGYAGPDFLWGSIVGTKEKVSDGWGGEAYVDRPGSAKDYAAQLKEIFEGDPKNVG